MAVSEPASLLAVAPEFLLLLFLWVRALPEVLLFFMFLEHNH